MLRDSRGDLTWVDCNTCPIVRQCGTSKFTFKFPDIFKLGAEAKDCPLVKLSKG